jgi:hypothetical protein
MKKAISIFCLGLVALCALIGSGCHKQSAVTSSAPQTLEEGMAQLQAALASASPQARSNFYNGVGMGMRYGDYNKATAALQQIASDPSLKEEQKKLVSTVGDLIKKAAETK